MNDSPTLLDLNNALEALEKRYKVALANGAPIVASRYRAHLDRVQALLKSGQGIAAFNVLMKG